MNMITEVPRSKASLGVICVLLALVAERWLLFPLTPVSTSAHYRTVVPILGVALGMCWRAFPATSAGVSFLVLTPIAALLAVAPNRSVALVGSVAVAGIVIGLFVAGRVWPMMRAGGDVKDDSASGR